MPTMILIGLLVGFALGRGWSERRALRRLLAHMPRIASTTPPTTAELRGEERTA